MEIKEDLMEGARNNINVADISTNVTTIFMARSHGAVFSGSTDMTTTSPGVETAVCDIITAINLRDILCITSNAP